MLLIFFKEMINMGILLGDKIKDTTNRDSIIKEYEMLLIYFEKKLKEVGGHINQFQYHETIIQNNTNDLFAIFENIILKMFKDTNMDKSFKDEFIKWPDSEFKEEKKDE